MRRLTDQARGVAVLYRPNIEPLVGASAQTRVRVWDTQDRGARKDVRDEDQPYSRG